MTTMPSKNGGRPRTQAERRETTRTALLDATLACLAEYGYAAVTTTKIVERAGVSRGAQVHHFHTKASLVAEAVRHLARRRAAGLRRQAAELPAGHDRVTWALDQLWTAHTGRLFEAALELWVAARTDADLRASLVPVEQEVIRITLEVSSELFGEFAETATFPAALTTAVTSIQGLALLGPAVAGGERELGAAWLATRAQLATLFATGVAPDRH